MASRAFLPPTACILALCVGCGIDFDRNSKLEFPVDAGGHDTGAAPDRGDGGDVDAGGVDVRPDAGPLCYLDQDGDGVGAGAPLPCSASGEAGPGASVASGGDCDDSDRQRSPSLSDVCGDKIDNDCDGKVDEEANNPCGGPCTSALEHQPGETCSNGLLGACGRPGKYVCKGGTEVTCNAPAAAGSAELCSDSVDNDCDGFVNEADAADAFPWYQDCDGDGYAASAADPIPACTKPAMLGTCTWTHVIPQPATKTNWDCDDASSKYSPAVTNYGLPTGGSAAGFDLNCNGTPDKEAAIRSTSGFRHDWCPVSAPSPFINCADWANPAGTRTGTQPDCSSSVTATYPTYIPDCSGDSYCEWVSSVGLQYCR